MYSVYNCRTLTTTKMLLNTTIDINEEDVEVIVDFNMYAGEAQINSIADLDGNVLDNGIIDTRENEHVYDECREKAYDMAYEKGGDY